MKRKTYKVSTKVWLWPAQTAAWHFVTVPKKESAEIKEAIGGNAKGFGSVPVEVTIGKTTWHTSVFPDRKSGAYVLPLKAKVRRDEDIEVNDEITFALKIR